MKSNASQRDFTSRPDIRIGSTECFDAEDWDFQGEHTQYLLHNLHPYPARFIPQIPRRAISRWSRAGDLVLDPFCGSGTTLLEALLAGRDSIGVDNNSVATLVASAKVANYSDSDFLELYEVRKRFSEVAKKPSSIRQVQQTLLSTSTSYKIPEYNGREKWFSSDALSDLGWLRAQLDTLSLRPRLLALAVFSSLVVRASRQDSDTRYAATNRTYRPGSALKWWGKKMEDAICRAREQSRKRPSAKSQVVVADSRNLAFIPNSSIDLIVTSPPYLNAYDYHKYHRHRFHWIGDDFHFSRDTEIGKHDTFTKPHATPEPYFEDLRVCMTEWERVLRPNSYAFVAVGDSIVSHSFVSVGDRLVADAGSVGLSLERRWVRNLDVTRKSFNPSSRIKREHLLLLKKG